MVPIKFSGVLLLCFFLTGFWVFPSPTYFIKTNAFGDVDLVSVDGPFV